MSGLTLTVHRGARQIGGSCIEIAHPSGERLILDAGRPLDADEDARDLLPATLDRTQPATVLFSHAHPDHWGLIDELPAAWPIWCGARTADLIAISREMRGSRQQRAFQTWHSRTGPLRIGAFTVTPLLTDHSAFDAYMLLVEAAGVRILYSGDFRLHGRKGALVERLMADPPPDIDVLVIEGTNLGSAKPCVTEAEIEQRFADLFARTTGRVFVSWSAQNIDRTVSIQRAAKRSGRTLAIDLYTADVLDRIAPGTGVPGPDAVGTKVVVTSAFARKYRREGREDFVARMAKNGMSARALGDGRPVVMIRRSLKRDFEKAGIVPSADDAFVFSMWSGYSGDPDHAELAAWFEAAGAPVMHIHTSGHASPDDLRVFAAAIAPRTVVPVHGFNWDDEQHGFGHITRLADGQPMVVAARHGKS